MARAGKLRLFNVTINRSYSATDDRLVPGDSLSVSIRRQGADAAETKTIATSNTTLAVRDVGALRVNDLVIVNTDTGTGMQVVSIDSRTQLTLKSLIGSGISVTTGDRILATTLPTVYSDNTGAASTTNPLTTSTTGYAECYVYEQVVDYIVSGTGYTTTLFTDYRTGAVDSFYNVLDYGAVGDGSTDDEPALNRLFDQIALLAPDEGISTVYFPRGVYLIATPLVPDGENVTGAVSGLRLQGEPGATIKAKTTAAGGTWTAPAYMLAFKNTTDANENWMVEGLEIDGSQVGAVGGATSCAGLYTSTITNLVVRDCDFHDFGDPAAGTGTSPRNDGIILGDDIGDASRGAAIDVSIENCRFTNCVRNGVSALDCEALRIANCVFNNCDNAAIDMEPNFAFQYMYDVTIRDCQIVGAGVIGIVATPGSSIQGAVYADQMESLKVSRCVINGGGTSGQGFKVQNWIDVKISWCSVIDHTDFGCYFRSCTDIAVGDCTITDLNTAVGGAAIKVDSGLTVNSATVHIRNNTCTTGEGYGIHLVDVDGGSCSHNVLDDFDNAGAARDNIRIERSAGTCQNVSFIGNVSTNNDSGSGLNVNGSSVANCLIAHNICLSNGHASQIRDSGTNTHWGVNITGSYASQTLTAEMTAPNAGAPAGNSLATAWAGIFTANSAVATTLVTNGNILDGNCRILCTPRSSAAAANSSAFYITGISAGQFKVKHTAAAGQHFHYVLLNT